MSATLAHAADAPVLDAARKRNILIAMCVSLMAVIASVSILNVAQQDLAIDFGASQGTVLWIINAYTLALAALLMPIGAIGDRWGRKPVLVLGLGLFAVATVAAAVAQSSEMMILARIVGGAAAAMIMPVTLSVITSSFPAEERGQAIGIWAGVAGGGGILGMFVAAFMVDVATWRWAFLLPLLLIGAGLFLSLKSVPNSREHSEHRFDIVGSILSLVGIGGVVLGIHEGPEKGWGDPLTLVGLIAGGAAVLGFVWWELRQDDPLLDIRTFANRGLSAGALTIMLLFAVMFGIFLVLFPFFQAILGWSALRSAAAMIPMMVVMMPTSTLAPRLVKKIGTRRTMLSGLVFAGAGLTLLAVRASVEGGYFSVLPGLLVIGLGMGLSMTPSTEAITESLPADKQGVASALNDTTREVGGAIGIALLGSIVSSGYADSFASSPGVAGLPHELVEPASEGIGSAYGVVQAGLGSGALDEPTAARIIGAAQHAFVDGWVSAMWVGVAIVVGAFLWVLLRGPRGKRSDGVLDHELHDEPADTPGDPRDELVPA
ncbi:MAG TPA: DHA2 family efflux MFS transporter permease subunit [Ilumatobacter sp.]|nr:DHA2 family efflux MFS transporter permease subunit [Ilumatobacter sp.]